MPPGPERINALRHAGMLRFEAIKNVHLTAKSAANTRYAWSADRINRARLARTQLRAILPAMARIIHFRSPS